MIEAWPRHVRGQYNMGVDVDTCFVCGASFIKPRKNATCCSPECAKRKEALRELERKKEKRRSDSDWLKNERSVNAASRKRNHEAETHRIKLWRERNPEMRKAQRKAYAIRHPEKIKEKKKRHHLKHPEYKVRYYLKSELGFTPPPELVEEATALRLLRRSIKKAGE